MHNVVKELLNAVENDPRTAIEILNRAGYHPSTFSHWKAGRWGPSFTAFVNIAQVLGYELTLRPIGSTDNSLSPKARARAAGCD